MTDDENILKTKTKDNVPYVGVALIIKDKENGCVITYSLPKPFRHPDLTDTFVEKFGISPYSLGVVTEGFISTDLVFVDRLKAAEVAKEHGVEGINTFILTSHHLW